MNKSTVESMYKIMTAKQLATFLCELLSPFPNCKTAWNCTPLYCVYAIGSENNEYRIKINNTAFPIKADAIFHAFVDVFDILGFELSYHTNIHCMTTTWTLALKEKKSDNFWGDL